MPHRLGTFEGELARAATLPAFAYTDPAISARSRGSTRRATASDRSAWRRGGRSSSRASTRRPLLYLVCSATSRRRPRDTAANGATGRQYALAGEELAALYYWVFPGWMLNIYPDNMSLNIVLPRGPDRCVTVFEWFRKEPDAPGVGVSRRCARTAFTTSSRSCTRRSRTVSSALARESRVERDRGSDATLVAR